ncbi:hypothetical protein BJY59DRAFT_704295 [Rhodotorula toruloides]
MLPRLSAIARTAPLARAPLASFRLTRGVPLLAYLTRTHSHLHPRPFSATAAYLATPCSLTRAYSQDSNAPRPPAPTSPKRSELQAFVQEGYAHCRAELPLGAAKWFVLTALAAGFVVACITSAAIIAWVGLATLSLVSKVYSWIPPADWLAESFEQERLDSEKRARFLAEQRESLAQSSQSDKKA